MKKESPYRHLRWLQRSGRYWIPFAQWPEDIKTHWDAFTRAYAREMRWATFDNYEKSFGYYVSYHLMSPEARLSAMPAEAQANFRRRGNMHTGVWRLSHPPSRPPGMHCLIRHKSIALLPGLPGGSGAGMMTSEREGAAPSILAGQETRGHHAVHRQPDRTPKEGEVHLSTRNFRPFSGCTTRQTPGIALSSQSWSGRTGADC